ncbi:hypothetical protein AOQ84DRAFT_94143 [Glonium stellatum]|uniref:Uncharacterized protein n=1 Tax=Glonium stellatum TaxID=574774 RepID=A0A8E2EVB4_9PEZI|nr:hypothetical protein AOQ84DRAFT_94143 [Glonium stellatum]
MWLLGLSTHFIPNLFYFMYNYLTLSTSFMISNNIISLPSLKETVKGCNGKPWLVFQTIHQ